MTVSWALLFYSCKNWLVILSKKLNLNNLWKKLGKK